MVLFSQKEALFHQNQCYFSLKTIVLFTKNDSTFKVKSTIVFYGTLYDFIKYRISDIYAPHKKHCR